MLFGQQYEAAEMRNYQIKNPQVEEGHREGMYNWNEE